MDVNIKGLQYLTCGLSYLLVAHYMQKELETCQSKNEEFQRQKDKEMNLIQDDLHNERIKAEECRGMHGKEKIGNHLLFC